MNKKSIFILIFTFGFTFQTLGHLCFDCTPEEAVIEQSCHSEPGDTQQAENSKMECCEKLVKTPPVVVPAISISVDKFFVQPQSEILVERKVSYLLKFNQVSPRFLGPPIYKLNQVYRI